VLGTLIVSAQGLELVPCCS